jgi:hypothetical protein
MADDERNYLRCTSCGYTLAARIAGLYAFKNHNLEMAAGDVRRLTCPSCGAEIELAPRRIEVRDIGVFCVGVRAEGKPCRTILAIVRGDVAIITRGRNHSDRSEVRQRIVVGEVHSIACHRCHTVYSLPPGLGVAVGAQTFARPLIREFGTADEVGT